ncbi:MAG: hypothetical protein ACKVOR_07055 [Flavobacteriales bacterium]
MMKNALLVSCLVCAVLCSSAQTYFLSAGLRAGTELGLTVQQKLWKQGTLESIITTNRDRWQLQGLVEYHRKFIGRRFNYYLGLGPHIGQERGVASIYYGFTPITGVEVTLAGITFSWDYKPSINLGGTDAFVFHDSGLSIRMVLVKERKKSLRERFGLEKKKN